MKIRPAENELYHAGEQTRMKLLIIVTLPNFANVPKNFLVGLDKIYIYSVKLWKIQDKISKPSCRVRVFVGLKDFAVCHAEDILLAVRRYIGLILY